MYLTQEYYPNDHITNILKEFQLQYVDKLPDIYCSSYLLTEYSAIYIGNPITFQDFYNGKYHDKTSNSDQQYAKRIKFWTNFNELQQFKKYYNLHWIVEYHRYILAYMLNHHMLTKNSLWTIYNDIKTLTRILNVMDCGKVYIKYNTLMESLHNYMVDLEQWNRISDKELSRLIDFEKLQDFRQDFEKEWRHKASIVGYRKTYKEHCKMLLLSMYILAKPERKEIMDLQIIYDWQDNNKKDDYLYINLQYNNCYYVLNKYKKKHDAITIYLSKQLSKLFIESITLYPRKYVFTHYSDLNKKCNISTVTSRMNKMFSHYGKTIGVSSIRSSFVSWLFRTNASTALIKQYAKEMRTSYYAFMSFYRKIAQSKELRTAVMKTEPSLGIVPKEVDTEIEETNYTLEEMKRIDSLMDLPEITFTESQPILHNIKSNVSYTKEYYKKNKEKILKNNKIYNQKNKTKLYIKQLLNKLNNNGKLRQKTILKWHIKYINGYWTSLLL